MPTSSERERETKGKSVCWGKEGSVFVEVREEMGGREGETETGEKEREASGFVFAVSGVCLCKPLLCRG